MEKQQNWSIFVCVFLFLSLASQIQCTRQTHFNAVRRINGPSVQTTTSRVNQEKLKNKDLIKKLPGQPSANFRQYGGYVAVNETTGRFLYYYFVESIQTNGSSPLVIWFNGGPGCSSLIGAFESHGPFRIHSDGKTLYKNPYSWNNEANMLYVESPIQVGFSYTNTPLTEFNSHGDTLTAEDNYMFLVKWLERFPEYKTREFYIGSQSYGGHYGPQLAQIILHRQSQTFINLRGMIIGNPAFDDKIDSKGNIEYMVNHALITKELVDRKNQICGSIIDVDINSKCGEAEEQIYTLIEKLDLYNVYAPMCLNSTLTTNPKKYTTVKEFDPCSAHYMTAYLNTENVQKAMHANTTKLPYPWKQCIDLGIFYNSTERYGSMLPSLQELVGKGIRIMVYSGDLDAAVSVTSTMHVLENLNLTVENPWRPWFSEREVGGYTEEYKGNFTFATVRGAGHAVPSDKPIRALTLFTSFIRNVPLPHM